MPRSGTRPHACAATPRAPAASPSSTSRRTELLPDSREHFGYADGFAQPALAGDDAGDRRVGGGVPEAKGAWRALAPGEFILGYEDEDTRVDPERGLPNAPADPFGRSGTYMVWRKLYQDVALFRHVLREAAALYGDGDHEKLAAKVVGRWPNGTPLVVSPDAPIPGFDARAAERQRLPLRRRRCRRPPLPAGRAHPPHQPARRARLRRAAELPPPHHPPRDALRPRRCPPRRPRTTTSTAAWSSSASTPASRASSRASRRSGSTTATSSDSATTATS